MRIVSLRTALAVFFAISVLVACNARSGVTPDVSTLQDTSRTTAAVGALATPTPSKTTVLAYEGYIGGNDTMFTGGVSASHEVSDGDYPAGGHGPLNTKIGPDGVPCLSAMYSGPIDVSGGGYHVHPFVGIFDNGKRIALPDGIGFADPKGDGTFNGVSNWTQYATHCYYETHTHDASGLVHVEASPPAPAGAYYGQYGTKYKLGDFLAVWGISVSPTNFGPLNGNVMVYTSGPVARGGPPSRATNGIVYSNLYSRICTACTAAQVGAIPLYSHEVIWVLVGSGNPIGSSLPNVKFGIEW